MAPKEPRAFVKNAADPEQTAEGRALALAGRELELADLVSVMSRPDGRRVMWRLLTHCGAFETVFSAEATVMAYKAGKQDVGHFLMAELLTADPDSYRTMHRESETPR